MFSCVMHIGERSIRFIEMAIISAFFFSIIVLWQSQITSSEPIPLPAYIKQSAKLQVGNDGNSRPQLEPPKKYQVLFDQIRRPTDLPGIETIQQSSPRRSDFTLDDESTQIFGPEISGPEQFENRPSLEPDLIQSQVNQKTLLSHVKSIYDISSKSPGKNRAFGSIGNYQIIHYIYRQLQLLGAYNVTIEPVTLQLANMAIGTLVVNGTFIPVTAARFSPNGTVIGKLLDLEGEGCLIDEFPASVAGMIVLIRRGTCKYRQKVINAGRMKAKAVIIMNTSSNDASKLSTIVLSAPIHLESDRWLIPTVGVSHNAGQRLSSVIKAGKLQAVVMEVKSHIGDITSFNVIAEKIGGDANHMIILGAHHDTSPDTVGINDNASGVVGLLEVAGRLASYETHNAVKFCFWAAEELGLWGSYSHVRNMSPTERSRIMAYMNFDMIASPNYMFGVLSSPGKMATPSPESQLESSEGSRKMNPLGSDDITELFEEFFDKYGYNHTRFYTDGRSDYGPFRDLNIPVGGLFSGGSENKTKEEVLKFGGTAGMPYDANYHTSNDDNGNINATALFINTRAIAYVVTLLAQSKEARIIGPKPTNWSIKDFKLKLDEFELVMGFTRPQIMQYMSDSLDTIYFENITTGTIYS